MTKLYVMLQNFLRDQRGISAVEYAVLAGILIVIIALGVTAFGSDITALFTRAGSALDGVVSP